MKRPLFISFVSFDTLPWAKLTLIFPLKTQFIETKQSAGNNFFLISTNCNVPKVDQILVTSFSRQIRPERDKYKPYVTSALHYVMSAVHFFTWVHYVCCGAAI